MSSLPASWHLNVPGGLEAPARARHTMAANLNGELSDERKFDACLLLHELVLNSVVHAGADASEMIEVEMTIADDAVRVAVSDSGSSSIPTVRELDAERGCGRGLRLVELLSDVWGMRREGVRGTTLWFELRRDAPRPV
jgi:anti-sigma regulatory factor (Ser/Thr protein kinase)